MNKPGNKKQNIRKDLKGPDAFQSKAMEGLGVLEQNKILLISAGIGIVVIVLGIWIFGVVKDKQKDEILGKLAEVEKVYTAAVKESDDRKKVVQKSIDDLEKEKQDLGKDQEGNKDKLAGIDEKIERFKKDLADIKPKTAQSLEKFQEFYKKNPKDPEGFMAGMRASALLLEQGKLGEARTILQEIVKNSGDLVVYQVMGHYSLMGVLEDLKDYKEAAKVADKLLAIAPKDLKPKVLLAKARILVEQKNQKDAIVALDNLIKDHGNSPEADQARTFKALIN